MSDLLHSGLIWYLSRGTGVVLVAVLTLSTALGVLAMRGGSTRWPRFALQSLHRNVSLIACALLLGHTVTPVIDTYVNHYATITAVDAVVPFVSAYQPPALGLGTLAFDFGKGNSSSGHVRGVIPGMARGSAHQKGKSQNGESIPITAGRYVH